MPRVSRRAFRRWHGLFANLWREDALRPGMQARRAPENGEVSTAAASINHESTEVYFVAKHVPFSRAPFTVASMCRSIDRRVCV
jgi:hypothetical protein